MSVGEPYVTAESEPDAGPGCGAGPAPDPGQAVADMDRMWREALAATAKGDSEAVLLNNRGYNYGPGPDANAILRELLRARGER